MELNQMSDSEILREILKELRFLNISKTEFFQKSIAEYDFEIIMREEFLKYLKQLETEGVIFEMMKEIALEQVDIDNKIDETINTVIDEKVEKIDIDEVAKDLIEENIPRDFKPYFQDLTIEDLGHILKIAISE